MTVKKKTKREAGQPNASALESLEMFRGVPAARLRELEKSSKAEEFRAGHMFFKCGEPGRAMYVLENGHVQTFRNFGERKLIIAELEAPALFGEMGCVGKRVYHCVAEATEPSQVRAISQTQMDELLEKCPEVTQKLLNLVSERFVSTLLELEMSSFRHLIPRLAKFLLERTEGDCIRDVTHAEIAERLRVFRESATSALGELRKAGIIKVERKRIEILDRARLERAARE